jgi:hypothetical protein
VIWRRGLFLAGIVHLPEPDDRVRILRSMRVAATLCGRFCRLDSEEDALTDRCPDCARIDGDRDHPATT